MIGDLSPVESLPELRATYTSFDGDHLADVGRMCCGATLLDFVPLNPEAALGYYVSTVSLGNQKPAVMRACLAVEFKADEFWIITDGDDEALKNLPEGVIAEYFIWRELRPDTPVRHFPWLGDSWLGLLSQKASGRAVTLDDALMSDDDHDTILASTDDRFRRNLDDSLLSQARSEPFMPVAYLSTAQIDDKHIDWGRRTAYLHGRVPFSPSTLIPKLVQDFTGLTSQERRSQRNALISRADEFWILAKPSEAASLTLPLEIRHDVNMARSLPQAAEVRLISWQDTGVPKYDPTAPWSLTEEEQQSL